MFQNKRIDILDGFRMIAILSVILFHYFSRWTTPYNSFNLYPYDNKYDHFGHGYLGVQFFFMISGFVIVFTLYQTDSFKTFWKKRFARLFPAMLICSLLSLIILRFTDTEYLFPAGHSIHNFIISLSFISPAVVNYCFRSLHCNYLCGSYWSLWPEIQFYCMASILYYLKPKQFIRHYAMLAFLIVVLNCWVAMGYGGTWITDKYNFLLGYMFNLPQCIGWFAAGVSAYMIHSRSRDRLSLILLLATVAIQLAGCTGMELWIMLFFIFLFALFLFYPVVLKFLSFKPITQIGVASYSLYLIHENIGVLLIHKYGGYFGAFDLIFPILILVIFICIALLIYRLIEKPISLLANKKKIPQL